VIPTLPRDLAILTRPDDAVDLNYWSNAESTVTIMAASIPILRVLFKDVKKSIFSSHRYHNTAGGGTSNSMISRKMQGEGSHKVMVTIGSNRSRPTSEGTDGSELNILHKEVASSRGGAIVQTNHYTVEYEERRPKDGRKRDDDIHGA